MGRFNRAMEFMCSFATRHRGVSTGCAFSAWLDFGKDGIWNSSVRRLLYLVSSRRHVLKFAHHLSRILAPGFFSCMGRDIMRF